MLVQPAVNAKGTQEPGSKKDQSVAADFNTFLTLLTSQLKNQDPLNPAEGTEFTAQLAQFSSLEQQVASNEYLQNIASQNDYTLQNIALGYIGKDVLAPGNEIYIAEGGGSEFGYTLAKESTVAIVEIKNEGGVVVKEIAVDAGKGEHAVFWDGKKSDGTDAPAGKYTLSLSASTSEGATAGGKLYTFGRVIGMSGQGNEALMETGDGRSLSFEDILSVRMPLSQLASG